MKKKNITHSKVKNPGLLFEMLVRQITVDILENNPNSKAISLMKKYFSPSTQLGKELQLYRSFFEINRLTEATAVSFVDLIAEQRKKLNEKTLAQEKYNLVSEIKKTYGDSFFKIKIPTYKVYASIYKTFLSEVYDFDVVNIQEVATSRFTLIEHLIKDKKPSDAVASEASIIDTFKNESEDLRLLAYKFLVEKFNTKYNNLNDKQKRLLKEYINSVSNSQHFIDYVHEEINPLKNELSSLASKEKDKVVQIKINEVVSQLEAIRERKRIRDNELTALMIAYQIAEELKTK